MDDEDPIEPDNEPTHHNLTTFPTFYLKESPDDIFMLPEIFWNMQVDIHKNPISKEAEAIAIRQHNDVIIKSNLASLKGFLHTGKFKEVWDGNIVHGKMTIGFTSGAKQDIMIIEGPRFDMYLIENGATIH